MYTIVEGVFVRRLKISNAVLFLGVALVFFVGLMVVSSSNVAAASYDDDVQTVINDINAQRQAAGLAPVQEFWGLGSPAQSQIAQIYDIYKSTGVFGHLKPGTSSRMSDTMAQFGFSSMSENLAATPNAHAAISAWMNSPGHRTNIMRSSNRYIGVGIVYTPTGQLFIATWFGDRPGLFTPNADVTRAAGANRYETAANTSSMFFDSASTVYIVTGSNYPDALSAGPAAGFLKAPMLFSEKYSIPVSTRNELERLNPSKIVVVGGTAAVSSGVFNALKSYAPSVVRQSGSNRYSTSAAISRAAFPTSTSTVYIATGSNYPDALAATPVAVYKKAPLLLVSKYSIDSAVRAELSRLRPSRIVVVGGTAAVSSSVLNALKSYAPSVTRVYGSNREYTARAISRSVFNSSNTNIVSAAYMYNWPDALAAGPIAAHRPGPLLLVGSTWIPTATRYELDRLSPEEIVIMGGTGVISLGVESQLAAYVR